VGAVAGAGAGGGAALSSPTAAEAASGSDWRTVDAATSEGTSTRRLRRVVAAAAVQTPPRVEVGARSGGLAGRWGLNLKAPGAREGACGSILPR
jgi:hypothetical protein